MEVPVQVAPVVWEQPVVLALAPVPDLEDVSVVEELEVPEDPVVVVGEPVQP